jgi:hypothetical protein
MQPQRPAGVHLVGGWEACIIGGGLDLYDRLLLFFVLLALFTIALFLSPSLPIITFSAVLSSQPQLPHRPAEVLPAVLRFDLPGAGQRQ